ncbi:MAG: D-alanyl-D-alanine carboxypeptidase family protein [Nitriliruptorales bacterium]|nr:D-alanyl-D-alanine carboxypeptidase family protein [Nitriliruptorales bacterium]
MRRLVGALLALLLVAALPPSWPEPPPVSAAAYLLIDATTGQPLAERGADVARPVASTVKMLTALTVVRHEHPSAVVSVGDEVAGLEGASVGLAPGDRWTVRDLLEALLVRSGNDAAVALAVHVGGSVEGFLDLMHEEAARFGVDDLVLATPSGLEDANQLSARDLAAIARAALDQPLLAEIAREEQVAIPTDPDAESRNLLLGSYPGATGIKTGYTERSGWSVVASAEREGRSLIAVVLGSDGPEARFEDAAALLDHGFSNFAEVAVSEELRLRIAGGFRTATLTAPGFLLPTDDTDVAVEIVPPVEVGALPEAVDVTWRGTVVAEAAVELEPAPRERVTGAMAVARQLHDRVYAAMRAATASGAWNR